MAEPQTHPFLPAGENYSPLNGDVINGAGYNEAIRPVFVDSFVPLKPVVLTADYLDTFDKTPDLRLQWKRNTIIMSKGVDTIYLR